MADKRTQFTWDPIALAAQLRNIRETKPSTDAALSCLISRTRSSSAWATGQRSGFEFFELMTRMITDPVAVARAQIDLFYNTLGIWHKNRGTHAHAAWQRDADAPKR